ncbi:preprotein translocase subunit SecE [Patescibacteria group bacterium]
MTKKENGSSIGSDKSPRGLFKKLKKNMISKIINFIKEAKVELLKVSWPTKSQVINYTLIVIAVGFFMAVFLGGLDYIFSGIIKKIIL